MKSVGTLLFLYMKGGFYFGEITVNKNKNYYR